MIWKYGANYTVEREGASDYSFEGSNVTFKNIIFEDNVATNNYYRGFIRAASMTFESCTLKNMMGYLGVGDVHFKDCVFDAASVCEYDISSIVERTSSLMDVPSTATTGAISRPICRIAA